MKTTAYEEMAEQLYKLDRKSNLSWNKLIGFKRDEYRIAAKVLNRILPKLTEEQMLELYRNTLVRKMLDE